MRMEEIDEINDLKDHLSNLKVIQNHIIFHHLLKGFMVIIKDKIVSVTLDLLLSTHISRNVPLGATAVFDSYSIEANKIGTGVSLQLFNVE
jgi:hypothetical protein